MTASMNGWAVAPLYRTVITAPGCADTGTVRAGAVAVIFQDFVDAYAAQVEPVHTINGYRSVDHNALVGGYPGSNHTSGTALDLNGAAHPYEWFQPASGRGLGYAPGFTAAQIATVRRLLAKYNGVLRWGLDFPSPRRDAMHFEIAGDAAEVSAVAARLHPTPPAPPVPEEDIMATLAQLQSVVREQTGRVLYKPTGAAAAYADLGTARRWVTGDQAHDNDRVAELPATDPFWTLPRVGNPGEVFRKTGDAAAFDLVGDGTHAHLEHVTQDTWAAMGKPAFRDLPASDPLWTLPVA
ncbi:M15 family metallopeptidase [Isoptericola sp. b441]|uniref:M15 family metallopeptidase n=1 Tax=Actinotalea lenta TaxID=3064654 RepID=A0ABT9DDS5_9CELL|nr:M15 family metallopeptidase [Isoptericola sp. b441]MDO8107157.1 M15 family metallopeptidase [Isoptericola sp. b441]